VTGINGGEGFKTTDIGRLVRIDNGAQWGWGVIVARTNTTVVSVHVKKAFAATTGTADWRLGAWSETTGYPQTAGFFEQRLYVAATTDQPQTFWGSQTGDFENLKPDNDAGTVEADDAFSFTLSADNVNAIRWLSAGEDTIVIGTDGGEWIPKSEGAVITPLTDQPEFNRFGSGMSFCSCSARNAVFESSDSRSRPMGFGLLT
jgi:hypothetical protein